MPIITVYGLAPHHVNGILGDLKDGIFAVVTGIPDLDFLREEDVSILFPADLSQESTPSSIVARIDAWVANKDRTTSAVDHQLVKEVGRYIQKFFPDVRIDCYLHIWDPAQGYWTSELDPTESETQKT